MLIVAVLLVALGGEFTVGPRFLSTKVDWYISNWSCECSMTHYVAFFAPYDCIGWICIHPYIVFEHELNFLDWCLLRLLPKVLARKILCLCCSTFSHFLTYPVLLPTYDVLPFLPLTLFLLSGMSGLVGSPFSAMNPFALQPCNATQPYGSSIVSPAKWHM